MSDRYLDYLDRRRAFWGRVTDVILLASLILAFLALCLVLDRAGVLTSP